jgi:hypothetical protein
MAGQKALSAVFTQNAPAIHALLSSFKDVDARHKAGHDDFNDGIERTFSAGPPTPSFW